MKILNGKECAEYYYSQYPKDIGLNFYIVTIGDDSASKVYLKSKIKACERLGIVPVHKVFPLGTDVELIREYLGECQDCNPLIIGLMIQSPIPKEYDTILEDVLSQYDVDGLNDYNSKQICTGKTPLFYPATPKGIMMLLDYYNIDVDGKHVVIINRSDIVGRPLANMMLKRNATVTVCHSHTKNLEEITRQADIIVTAVGKSKYLDKEYLFSTEYSSQLGCEIEACKHPIIIDVAMCRDENGKLCGDVDFESVKPYVSAITPVPGGVGPMTVCALMSNLVESYKKRYK